MIFSIGEILIDRFPDYERIGGAPFNFAFHLKQMGLPVRFMTRIGRDAYGRQILDMLRAHGFSREDIQIDSHHATGKVDVSLDSQGIPQFEICTDTAYDHLDLSRVGDADLSSAQMVYFGSLSQRSPHGFRQVQLLLKRIDPSICAFCDINLRPPHINPEAIESSLKKADVLKLNEDELALISRMLKPPRNRKEESAAWLMRSFGISRIALTKGAHGSKIITPGESIDSPPLQDIPVVDTVGAGDAYASVLAAGLLKKFPLPGILELATEFAAYVCGLPGAIPSADDPFYDFLRRRMND